MVYGYDGTMRLSLPGVAGFTLIELLVAIVIIGVISSFGILKFVGEQARGRDVERKAHLSQLAASLENYHNDKGSYIVGDTCLFYEEIASYMKTLKAPYDPLFESNANDTCLNSSSMHYSYRTEDNGKSYRLYAKLENCNDPQVISRTSCFSDQYNYTVTSANLTALAFGSLTAPLPPTLTPSPTLTLTPTPTPAPAACADGTSEQVYSSSMVGCNGTATTPTEAQLLCGSTSHLCTLDEYLARGGSTTPVLGGPIFRWLGTKGTFLSNCPDGNNALVSTTSDTSYFVSYYIQNAYLNACSGSLFYLGWLGNPSSGAGANCCS